MPVASDKGGGNYQLAPIGNHVAICVQVIDLGTQNDEYMGKPKILRKVRLAWELPEEKAVFDEAKGEECFLVAKEYTLSLGEKANLRHDIQSWRGVDFTEEELKSFELKRLLGAACMVNVVHETSKNKRKYVKITSVTRLPKKIKKADVPKPTLEMIGYDIEDGMNDAFKKLPQFLQEKILASVEVTGGGPASNDAKDAGKGAPDDDDIPF
jgi:hypothetical protein